MKLKELLTEISKQNASFTLAADSHPSLDVEVTGLSTNSQVCQPGNVFIGLVGTRVDGGDFWRSAIANGAIAAIISSQAASRNAQKGNPGNALIIPVSNPALICSQAASAFYEHPAKRLKMIGVTGTNGKTITTHLTEFLLNHLQHPTAMIGSLYNRWSGYQKTAVHTTPFSIELQQYLSEAAKAGCQTAVMEVSSHALEQSRVFGCRYDAAIFTNLMPAHLDYHKTMESYFAAKSLLFSPEYLYGRAIINIDDPYGEQLAQSLSPDNVWTYSIKNRKADLWVDEVVCKSSGSIGQIHTPAGSASFRFPLVGQYNLHNLLAAIGATLHLGLNLNDSVRLLPQFKGVPGRMEKVEISPEQDISVIVDYARTTNELQNLLTTTRPFIQGQVICVFGCGGNRDWDKRSQKGQIVSQWADSVIVTSDHPRMENPEQIAQDILAGIRASSDSIAISDRAEAIRAAVLKAKPGDGVVIAGKGHENYQIWGTERVHFDDREQARRALHERLSLTCSGH